MPLKKVSMEKQIYLHHIQGIYLKDKQTNHKPNNDTGLRN